MVLILVGAKFPHFFIRSSQFKPFLKETILKSLTFKFYKVLLYKVLFFFFWPSRNYAENILHFQVLLIKATLSARDSARSAP